MKIENSFTVDAPIEEAWELLTNIPEITPCLPGAKLTGEEDGVYSGGIKVKVGPVTAEYKGSAQFVEKDDSAYKAVIDGKGRDTRGAGNAQALITAQMSPEGDKTKVDITTDLKISGKVAQFGRGVMQDISEKLLGQFADCLETKIGDDGTVDDVAAAKAESGDSTTSEASSAKSVGDRAAEIKNASASASSARSTATSAAASGSATAAGSNDDDDDDALDLLDVAGGAMAKRALPAAAGAAAIIAFIIWIISRG